MRIRGRPLDTTVAAVIAVVPVAVVLAVGLVVLVRVRHQVTQTKAIVRGHVVHRLRARAATRLKQIGRRAQPQRKLAARALPLDPELAHRVAEAVVPFEPGVREAAQLIAAGADVPGLGNHLQARQQRVLRQGNEERRVAVEALVAAPEHRRQIETEAVDMHLGGPVTQ